MLQTALMGFAKGLNRACCVLICRHGKSNFCIRPAANQPDGQITSDYQK
jgi:hypothetical protein